MNKGDEMGSLWSTDDHAFTVKKEVSFEHEKARWLWTPGFIEHNRTVEFIHNPRKMNRGSVTNRLMNALIKSCFP